MSKHKLAKTVGPLVERVLGSYGKGLVKAALGESYYEKGEDNYKVMRRLLAEAEEVARRYPLYLKKRAAVAADFKGVALTILRLQADGLSVNRIAQRLDLKPDNVKYHIKENYRKLNVDNKTDALLAARSLGIL